jgi:hypothetical protein
VQRGLAAAGVALDSAPPAGVFTTEWSFVKANWPMINPLIPATTPRLMAFEDFQYAFVNALPPAEQRAAVVAVDMHGHSVAEAAALLNVAEGTVKSRCARGRARLAALLDCLSEQ